MIVYQKQKDINKAVTYLQERYAASHNNIWEENRRIHDISFHHALVNGDREFVESVLKLLDDPNMKLFALNTSVIHQRLGNTSIGSEGDDLGGSVKIDEEIISNIKCSQVYSDCDFELPLALAAMANDKELLEMMVTNGADIYAEDSKGNNIIHSLVYWSTFHPQEATGMYLYIVNGLVYADRYRLVKHQNMFGITPLDLASKCRLPEIILLIMNTEGVYKFEVKNCISHRHVLYDISDYEGRHARKSPLHFLKSITVEVLPRFDKCRFFKQEPLSTWLQARKCGLMVMSCISMAFWLVYFILYLIQLLHFLHSKSPPFILNIALFIIAILSLLADTLLLMSCTGWPIKWSYVRHLDKLPATFTFGYKLLQMLFSGCVVSTTVLHSVDVYNSTCTATNRLQMAHAVTQATGLMSILFFRQLNDEIGHVMIMIQRMLYDLLSLISIICISFLATATSFYILYFSPTCSNAHTLQNSTNNQNEYFSTFPSSLFNTFLLSFSIFSPPTDIFGESQLAIAVYMLSVIFMSILLVNLLIGIMGKQVTEITEQKDTLLKLENISIMEYSDNKRQLLFWLRLGRKWSRHYKYNKDGSQVYIEVIEKGPNTNMKYRMKHTL